MLKNQKDLLVDKARSSYGKTANEQFMKGLQTYGQPLEPLEQNRDWLQMMEEEIVDSHQYLVAEREKRNYIANEIREIIDLHEEDMDPFYVGKAHDLLNQLNGSDNKGR